MPCLGVRCACEQDGNAGAGTGLGESMTLSSFLHVLSVRAWGSVRAVVSRQLVK